MCGRRQRETAWSVALPWVTDGNPQRMLLNNAREESLSFTRDSADPLVVLTEKDSKRTSLQVSPIPLPAPHSLEIRRVKKSRAFLIIISVCCSLLLELVCFQFPWDPISASTFPVFQGPDLDFSGILALPVEPTDHLC